jgi:hypothetical protein
MEVGPVSETFKKHWFFDRITSSSGYMITLRHDFIELEDSRGRIRIEAEWSPRGRRTWVTVFASTIPDAPDRGRDRVLDDLKRAFDAVGWRMNIH